MTNCPNFDCTWRYDQSQHDHCPKCGEPAPPKDNRPYAWNSTIKVNPKKRIKPRSKSRANGKLAKSMRDFARKFIENHQGRTHCQNCGLRIIEMKYDNVSHDLSRGAHPEKMFDENNMTILCSSIDIMLSSFDEGPSCHDLWERNDTEGYKARKDKYK